MFCTRAGDYDWYVTLSVRVVACLYRALQSLPRLETNCPRSTIDVTLTAVTHLLNLNLTLTFLFNLR